MLFVVTSDIFSGMHLRTCKQLQLPSYSRPAFSNSLHGLSKTYHFRLTSIYLKLADMHIKWVIRHFANTAEGKYINRFSWSIGFIAAWKLSSWRNWIQYHSITPAILKKSQCELFCYKTLLSLSRGSLFKTWPKPETAHEKSLAPRVGTGSRPRKKARKSNVFTKGYFVQIWMLIWNLRSTNNIFTPASIEYKRFGKSFICKVNSVQWNVWFYSARQPKF